MLNTITLQGRLTRDPELRNTASGIAVASFALACDRDYGTKEKRETDFFDVVAWRHTAEFASKYFKKGQLAVVHGRLQSRKWKDKEDKLRVSIEIVAEHIYFADSKKDNGTASHDDTPGSFMSSGSFNPFAGDDNIPDDGELPF